MRHANSTTRKNTGRQSTGSRRTNQNNRYIEGSAVRKLQTTSARQEHERTLRQIRSVSRTRVKAVPMNMGYIGVAAVAILIACVVLMAYVNLANDETYTKIMSSIDLEEIKRIAVNELGMKYAKEGQVVEYTGEGNDYVRQYGALPE